jgi:outer membrane protein TolC
MLLLLALAASGCASLQPKRQGLEPMDFSSTYPDSVRTTSDSTGASHAGSTQADTIAAAYTLQPEVAPEEISPGRREPHLHLDDVIESVHRSFPLLEAALLTRNVASGEHLAAHGAFDLKLKGDSMNGPLGFYQTYRQAVGLEQPTYWGGTVLGGYRIGRGNFPSWYGERQTDDGGEFRAGVAIPLARNVDIDGRRAQLWRTNLDRRLAEPEIRLQLIDFVQSASYAYWDWVAAGRRKDIAVALLKLAEDRNDAIRRRVETGDMEPPVLQDNRRLIVSREAKLIESRRKLEQAAIKLSLFYRDDRGEPLVVAENQLAVFLEPQRVAEESLDSDIQAALANRPELLALNLLRQQMQIDLAEARNELLPEVRAELAASQDVGAPATSKNDKSEFELEAGLFVDVPLQRRKAWGKVTAVEGKLGQLSAKQRMAADKITTDVQAVYAALVAAFQQTERARESVTLADRLAEIERRKFELGESDLLSVNLREQQAAEAQSTEVDALYEYFTARADYRAALARD